MSQRRQIDETDLKILRLLRMNARLSYREIGKQISVSTGTVSERVKQMLKDGVIKGFVTAVAPEKMGYDVTMLFEIRISQNQTLEVFEEALLKIDEACCVQYVTGEDGHGQVQGPGPRHRGAQQDPDPRGRLHGREPHGPEVMHVVRPVRLRLCMGATGLVGKMSPRMDSRAPR